MVATRNILEPKGDEHDYEEDHQREQRQEITQTRESREAPTT
jgi:hypothetical protein